MAEATNPLKVPDGRQILFVTGLGMVGFAFIEKMLAMDEVKALLTFALACVADRRLVRAGEEVLYRHLRRGAAVSDAAGPGSGNDDDAHDDCSLAYNRVGLTE